MYLNFLKAIYTRWDDQLLLFYINICLKRNFTIKLSKCSVFTFVALKSYLHKRLCKNDTQHQNFMMQLEIYANIFLLLYLKQFLILLKDKQLCFCYSKITKLRFNKRQTQLKVRQFVNYSEAFRSIVPTFILGLIILKYRWGIARLKLSLSKY